MAKKKDLKRMATVAGMDKALPVHEPTGLAAAPADYDVDIEVTDEGKVKAPGGISAQQMAIMFPGFFGSLTSEEVGKVERGEELKPQRQAPPGRRPPEGFRPTDFSNRDLFQEKIIDEIGFDPIRFDPMDYVNDAMQQLPQLFDYVFQGTVMWGDRDKLNRKQWDHWQEAVKRFRAGKFQEAQQQQKRGLMIYNYSMNEFDRKAALKEKRMQQFQKPPKTQNRYSEAKKAVTVHEWDPATRSWQDTGARVKAPKEKGGEMPPKVKTAWSVVKSLMRDYGGEDIGDVPTTPDEATERYTRIQSFLGTSAPDPRLKKIYEKNLKVVMDWYGLGEDTLELQGGSAVGKSQTKLQPTQQPKQPKVTEATSWKKYRR